MENDFTNELLNILHKNLNLDEKENFITTLFEQRSENFHIAITKNTEYKKMLKKIGDANDKLIAKYENAYDIIDSIEEYNNSTAGMENLIETLMYQYGLYDGIMLICNILNMNKNLKFNICKKTRYISTLFSYCCA